MSNSKIVYNLMKPLLTLSDSNSRPSVFYDYQSSIIDHVICEIANISFYTNRNYLSTISFDSYWTDNPTQHTNNVDDIRKLHIPGIVYFRDTPPNNIKKEDKFLIQNKFANSHQIYRNKAIKQHWGINSDMVLEYGVPCIELDSTPTKSMVLINSKKQKSLYMLYNQIRQHWPDIEILDNIADSSVSDISNKLQQYQICISAEDDYNVIFGVSNGCMVLSNKSIDNCNYIAFSNMEEMLDNISLAVKNHQHYDRKANAHSVTKHYNFDIFSTYINHYIMQILREPVLI